MTAPVSEFLSRHADVSEAVERVRRSLRTCLDQCVPAEAGGRSCGRALGVDRTLGWRCWSIAHTSDLATVLRMLPGARGWRLVLKALDARGVATGDLADGIDLLQTATARNRLDRDTLRAIGAGRLDGQRGMAQLLATRRQASRANRSLYGVHVGRVAAAQLVGPPASDGAVDLAYAAVFDGLARTRPGPPWPVIVRSVVVDDDRTGSGTEEDRRAQSEQRADPIGAGGRLPPLVEELSSEGIALGELQPGVREGFASIDLADVAPARSGSLRACFAEIAAKAGTLRHSGTELVNLWYPTHLPCDLLVLDMLLHERLLRGTEPAVALYGTPLPLSRLAQWSEEIRLPLEVEARPIATPALPRTMAKLSPAYLELLRRTVAAMGCAIEEFAPFRVVVPAPPLFSGVSMRCELALPQRSAAG
jgi:hypothetical protein